jgi:hypothetical protein
MMLQGAQYQNPTPQAGGGGGQNNPLQQTAMNLINSGNVPMQPPANAFNPPGGPLRVGGYHRSTVNPMKRGW